MAEQESEEKRVSYSASVRPSAVENVEYLAERLRVLKGETLEMGLVAIRKMLDLQDKTLEEGGWVRIVRYGKTGEPEEQIAPEQIIQR